MPEPLREAGAQFECFGSTCAVFVMGDAPGRTPERAVDLARTFLLDWHARFSRFDPGSELSRLNADEREVVPVSEDMTRFVASIAHAADETGALVDATLLGELEAAGYVSDLGTSVPLARALEMAPPRRPARPSPERRWERIEVDFERRTVRRPPGLAVDSGGLVKGLAADVLAERLAGHATFAIEA